MSWSPRPTRCGSTTETVCAAARFDSPTRPRCAGWRNGWRLSAGRRLDEAQPWVDGQLTGLGTGQFTVRLHAVLPPIAAGGTCLSLRVLRPATQDLAALTRTGTIAPQAAALLDDIIACAAGVPGLRRHRRGQDHAAGGRSWARCPPTSASSVWRTPPSWSPRHPHLVKLVARCANVEGVGEVTVRDLVKQALRMRPDRIVVGEVRGAEVVDLLAALNTGHDGGAGTVHANSPAEVPARLEALGGARRARPRGAAQSARRRGAGASCTSAATAPGRRRLSEIAVLARGDDGRVRAVHRVARRTPDSAAAPSICATLMREPGTGHERRGAGAGARAADRRRLRRGAGSTRSGSSRTAAPPSPGAGG